MANLFDPRNGDLAFKIEPIDAKSLEGRFNYFSIYWIHEGAGTFWADQGQHEFDSGNMLFFVPYQRLRIVPHAWLPSPPGRGVGGEGRSARSLKVQPSPPAPLPKGEGRPVAGMLLQFHANFLCIETHNAEVGCQGVLFNDIYGAPLIEIDADREHEFQALIGQMRRELAEAGVAHSEALLSYLKIFLVQATRLKHEQQRVVAAALPTKPAVLDDLKKLLESNYRAEHSPSFYARRLHLATKSLGKLVKTHLHKTLTELIRERILNQAKWDLLHTLKPIKQVAAEVGFDDELYFSRMFKRATGCSPSYFREFETTIRAGQNVWEKG